jgi:transposase
MQVLYPCCCGIDIHARTAVACLIKQGKRQTRTFSTMTDDLLRLSDWLTSEGCTHVAIDSTGVYWNPVFNLLEATLTVILVNARDAKAVPGRKTDVRDCEWLADLLRHGLLRASFIPPLEIRELRELTRYRQTLIKEHTAVANRIQKLIESANIKLGQVATDVFGVSGRLMLRALADGEEEIEQLVALARGSLKGKQVELRRALTSRLTPAQRFVLNELLQRLSELEAATARVGEQIVKEVAESADPFVPKAMKLLQTIPGIGLRVAEVIISEIGVDMTRFPTDASSGKLGRRLPGQQRISRQAAVGSDDEGQSLPESCDHTSRVGSGAHERDVLGGAVSPTHQADGQEQSLGRRRAQPAGDRLSRAGPKSRLPGTGRRLLRPPASADAAATLD